MSIISYTYSYCDDGNEQTMLAELLRMRHQQQPALCRGLPGSAVRYTSSRYYMRTLNISPPTIKKIVVTSNP